MGEGWVDRCRVYARNWRYNLSWEQDLVKDLDICHYIIKGSGLTEYVASGAMEGWGSSS